MGLVSVHRTVFGTGKIVPFILPPPTPPSHLPHPHHGVGHLLWDRTGLFHLGTHRQGSAARLPSAHLPALYRVRLPFLPSHMYYAYVVYLPPPFPSPFYPHGFPQIPHVPTPFPQRTFCNMPCLPCHAVPFFFFFFFPGLLFWVQTSCSEPLLSHFVCVCTVGWLLVRMLLFFLLWDLLPPAVLHALCTHTGLCSFIFISATTTFPFSTPNTPALYHHMLMVVIVGCGRRMVFWWWVGWVQTEDRPLPI